MIDQQKKIRYRLYKLGFLSQNGYKDDAFSQSTKKTYVYECTTLNSIITEEKVRRG